MHRGLILLCCACGSATSAPVPVTPANAGAAWATLQRNLLGRWVATTGDATVPVEFHAVAGGSVVLETFGREGRQTVTAYHTDGAELVATHYCAQGNQPRLRARVATEQRIELVMMDATGGDVGEAVLGELSYTFDSNGFERVEVYRQADGRVERTTWRYSRAPD